MTLKRPAFTMIELVMAIVVLGILAALALPRLERDVRQEAADNILSAIRYTQHMAMNDNVVDPSVLTWQQKFWRFSKVGCADNGIFYQIASDTSMLGGIDQTEAAVDSTNGGWINGLTGAGCATNLDAQVFANGTLPSRNIFLTKLYGIIEDDATMFGDCPGATTYVGFDYLGRPHTGFENSAAPDYSTVIATDCNLTFRFQDGSDNLIINIQKETGYASIVKQANS